MSESTAGAPDMPIRPASSVVLVRDRRGGGIELFMMERTSAAVFAGGMYVFPGGRVDEADSDDAYAAIAEGPSDVQQRQKEALGDQHLAFWVAGIRETFEEAGLLLAYTEQGTLLDMTNDAVQARVDSRRTALHQGKQSLLQVLREEGLRLAVDQMHFYHRWITPPGRARRFDTRFFFAHAPEAQQGVHDNMETVHSLWITPADALARNRDNKLGLMPVTRRQLEEFERFKSAQSMIDAAVRASEFAVYRPELPAGQQKQGS